MLAIPAYPDQIRLITRRCVNGFFFLVPDERTVQILLFLLSHYAKQHNIQLIALVIMSNHLHLAIRDPDGRHSAFLRDVFSRFATVQNERLGRRGHFFELGPPDKPSLEDARAEMDALLYLALNPTAHITPESRTWPGLIFTPEDVRKRFHIERPPELDRYRSFPDVTEFTVAPPKHQDGDSPRRIRDRFRFARMRNEEAARRAHRESGTPYVGVEAAMKQPPFTTPHAPLAKSPRGQGRKLFFASTPDRVAAINQRLRGFRRRYRDCLESLRAGQGAIVWPAGTNYHHHINGFPREAYSLKPAPS